MTTTFVVISEGKENYLRRCIYAIANNVKNTPYDVVLVGESNVLENYRSIFSHKKISCDGSYGQKCNVGFDATNNDFVVLLDESVIIGKSYWGAMSNAMMEDNIVCPSMFEITKEVEEDLDDYGANFTYSMGSECEKYPISISDDAMQTPFFGCCIPKKIFQKFDEQQIDKFSTGKMFADQLDVMPICLIAPTFVQGYGDVR